MTWEMKCLSSLSARWNFYPQKKRTTWWSRWVLKTIFMTTLMLISFGLHRPIAISLTLNHPSFDGYLYVCGGWKLKGKQKAPQKTPSVHPPQNIIDSSLHVRNVRNVPRRKNVFFPLLSSATVRLLLLCGLKPSINFHFHFLIPPSLHERRTFFEYFDLFLIDMDERLSGNQLRVRNFEANDFFFCPGS